MAIGGCAALAFLGAYTIAFAQEPTKTPRAADITSSNAAFGR
jgi:hypothetical protein